MIRAVFLGALLSGCEIIPVAFPGDAGAQQRPECGAGNPCATPLICDASGECVECSVDANCGGATPACEPTTKRCVPCRGAVGCTGSYVCSPSAAICVLPCMDGNGCPGFIEGCSANVCSACNDDEDCAAGMFCDKPHGRCVGCLSDANCSGTTPKCHQSTGLCGACVRNTDCPGGGVCFQGACRPAR